MADLALQEIVAEYSVKDLATKSVKSIDKEIEKSVKSTKKFETELKKSETALGRMAKAAKGTGAGVAGAAGEVAQKPVGLAERTISGGLIGAAASVPIIGGLMSAIMGATGDVKDKFVQALSLKKELLGYSADISKSFGRNTKEALKGFDSTFSTLTQQQKAMSGFAKMGVSAELLTPEFKTNMSNLAKAMGVNVEDVTKNIDATSGLDMVTRMQAKKYMELMQTTEGAEIGTQLYSQLLKEHSAEIKKASDMTQNTTDASGNSIKAINAGIAESKTREQSNKLILTEEGRYLDSMAALRIAYSTEAVAIKAKGFGAKVETTVVGAIRGERDTRFQEWQEAGSPGTWEQYKNAHPSPGRANGGDVKKGHTYEINEKGQEFFTPSTSGKIIPNNQLTKNNSASIVMNNTFNISGASGNIQAEIEAALNNQARSLSYALGIGLPQ